MSAACTMPLLRGRRKSIQKGGPGFGYGFVCAFCFTLAFFCLLCGLVLDGFKDVVQDQLAVKREWQAACAEWLVLCKRCRLTMI